MPTANSVIAMDNVWCQNYPESNVIINIILYFLSYMILYQRQA